MMEFIHYITVNQSQILSLLLEHIQLTSIAVGCSVLIGVPLGILISYIKRMGKPILGIANIVQAVPSMALLGLVIPLLGIGVLPAIVMVIIYSLLPIIKNTYTGLESINPQTVDAAKGIGLTKSQVLFKVKLPLALPIIMAGIRISAVTAVGLMTMAAYIGAGGLGYLVFSGIRSVNNYQILAGAIPSCILALLVDYLASLIEKLVTPISLQNTGLTKKENLRRRRKQKSILAVAGILVVVIIGGQVISGLMAKEDKSIIVGGKDYTEQEVLVNLYSEYIENKTDISVIRKPQLGGTQVMWNALKKDEIDAYLEYTGTAYVTTLKHPINNDTNKVYDTVKKDFKKYGLDVLKKTRFNNTYTLSVTKETAKKYNLKSISDLAKVSKKLTIGATLQFLNQDDGLPTLSKKYGLNFKKKMGMDGAPRYTALENGEVDVIDAYSTEGLLKKYDLISLEDDKHFFPPYQVVPVIRQDTYKKYPELEKVMNNLSNHLTNEVMMDLNYQVDELGKDPSDVAKTFLQKEGLID